MDQRNGLLQDNTHLATDLTQANHLPLFLTQIAQAPCASTHIAMLMRGIAIDQAVRRDIPRDDGACTDECERANGDATDDDRASSN